jgi:hypothetical protein
MRRNLIFVHIPKTGGTSARMALLAHAARRNFIFDYGPNQAETTEGYRDWLYDRSEFEAKRRRLRTWRGTYIVGHFHARKYWDVFPARDFATILREPFARVLSEFNHRQSRGRLEPGVDFSAFLRDPRYCNMMTRALDGVDIDRFGFLGLTETIDQDLVRFSRFLGSPIEITKANKGRYDETVSELKHQSEMREEALHYNREDEELYRYVEAKLAGRAGERPTHVVASQKRVTGNCWWLAGEFGVEGWVDRTRWGRPREVQVIAAGVVVGEGSTTVRRDEIWNLGFSDHRHCGFKVVLARGALPAGATTLEVREKSTGLPLRGSPLALPPVDRIGA